jgi:hypothetical protein
MENTNETIQLLDGTYVVARHEGGQKSKQQTRWHGPYRITQMNNRPQGTVSAYQNIGSCFVNTILSQSILFSGST